MKENQFSIEPDLGSIPAKGTTCWYIRANMVAHKFVIQETEWVGGVSDLLRMAKGNMFFSLEEANEVETQLNERLEKFKAITQTAEFKQKLADDEAKKKAESEERKRKREEALAAKRAEKEAALVDNSPSGKQKKYALSTKERALKYESRKKKSPHPDIVM
jgi:hypothetical protein